MTAPSLLRVPVSAGPTAGLVLRAGLGVRVGHVVAVLLVAGLLGAGPGLAQGAGGAEDADAAGLGELEEGEVLELGDDDDEKPAEAELEDGDVLDLSDDDDVAREGPAGADGSRGGESPTGEEEPSGWASLEEDFTAFLEGNWLDPPGEFWAVRRGSRFELAFYLGGEAAAGKIQPGDILVSNPFGGITLSPVFRWYPVDQVALVVGLRGYAGIGSETAAGTDARTVLTPYFGVRYDLVKESRLSILIDVYSGPTAFLEASVYDPSFTGTILEQVVPQWALGAEIAGGLVGRYSLGPTTFELRGLLGGRAGSATQIGRPSNEDGPFSAFYAGIDLGITWSFFADGRVLAGKPEEPKQGSDG